MPAYAQTLTLTSNPSTSLRLPAHPWHAGYGYHKVATVSEYARAYPHALPNKKYEKLEDDSWAKDPVAAVIVVETPMEWHEDLQVICDLMR